MGQQLISDEMAAHIKEGFLWSVKSAIYIYVYNF